MTSTTTAAPSKYGMLIDANTGAVLRPAREDEWRISGKLARIGQPNRGVFCYGRMEVYVAGGEEWQPEPPAPVSEAPLRVGETVEIVRLGVVKATGKLTHIGPVVADVLMADGTVRCACLYELRRAAR